MDQGHTEDEFNGSISITRDGDNLIISIQNGQAPLSGHILGHVLAAVVATFTENAKRQGVKYSPKEIHEDVINGMLCRLSHAETSNVRFVPKSAFN